MINIKNNLIIVVIIALIVGGGVGFFAGMTYQKSQKSNFANFNTGNFQGNQRNGNAQFEGRNGLPNGGNRPTSGEIISKDDKSITIKIEDGSSKIVLITKDTSINKASEGTLEDLKEGESVLVFGTTNSDGIQTALSVQLNPQMRFSQRISPTPKK